MRKIVTLILIIFVILSMTACGVENEYSEDLTLIGDYQTNVEYNEYLGWSVEIIGTLKNTSGKDLSFASIEFSLYDESGNVIDTAYDNISSIKEGDTWRFKATNFGIDKKPIKFEISDITCW